MAASLLLSCNLNEQKLPRFVFLREDIGVDGSFVISSVLGQRLKVQNTGTILVCLQNSFEHYSSAGIRLGYNLSACRDKGALIVIEPLLDLAENVCASNYLSASGEKIVESFWLEIERAVARFTEPSTANKQTITLIIDNLSSLIDLGVNENRIVQLCRELGNYSNELLSIVVKVNTCQLYETLCCNLEDIAETEIKIVKLQSGNFKEVDGRIVCLRRAANGYEKSEKTVLYKVNDRNVKIFAPGEVGAKA